MNFGLLEAAMSCKASLREMDRMVCENSKKMRRVCKPFSHTVSWSGMGDPCPSGCMRLCATQGQPTTFHRCNVQAIWG